MKKDLLHTPEGVRDIYNGECAAKLILQNKLHNVCTLYGYNDIQTPSFEFFDVFNKERGCVPSNEMFKFFDRYGNTLVLRPDITPSIARSAAKYFADDEIPLKLCYEGNTFINNSKYYQGKLKESTAIGAELIGDASINADYEIICMVIECMKSAGLKEFQVEIGNVRFFNGLLKEGGISDNDKDTLIELIQQKNYFGVEELLDSLNIDSRISDVLLKLPQMFGSVEVLSDAKRLTKNEDCIDAINRLLKLYELLKITGYEKYVSFDLGSLSIHEYYTGIIFSGYTYGTGEAVVSGGRYNKLLGQFGCDKAAIGFSLNVDSLMTAMSRQKLEIPVEIKGALLIYDEENTVNAIKLSESLRSKNVKVSMLSSYSRVSVEDYIEYAAGSQLKNVILLNNSSIEENQVIEIINVTTGKNSKMTISDILKKIAE